MNNDDVQRATQDFEADIGHPPCPFSFTAASWFSPGGHEAGYGRQRKKDKDQKRSGKRKRERWGRERSRKMKIANDDREKSEKRGRWGTR